LKLVFKEHIRRKNSKLAVRKLAVFNCKTIDYKVGTREDDDDNS
jgi:hypothetical protein